MSNTLIDALHTVLVTESRSTDITRLPSAIIMAAMVRMDELKDIMQGRPNPALLQEYESIETHLSSIATARARKIAGADSGTTTNLLPHESAFLATVTAAKNELMTQWGIPE